MKYASILIAALVVCVDSPLLAQDDLVPQIVKLLGNSDREFQAAALERVRTSARGVAHTKTFAAELPKLEPASQAALATALGDRGDDAAKPALLELLAATKSEDVRAAVLSALGDLGSVADLPLLIKSVVAGSGPEQQAAKSALIRLRGEGVLKGISSEMKSASPQAKTALIDVLATRRAMSEVASFLTATADDDQRVRMSAMNALGQLGSANHVAEMIPGLLKSQKGGERDNAEKNVAFVCARIDNESQRADALIAAYNATAAASRDDLLPLIGRVGGKKLINFVGDIATGSDAKRRAIGVEALSKWPDASTADKLLEIANKATDEDSRWAAFDGYVKVASNRDKRSDKERLDRMKQALKAAKNDEEKLLVIRRCRTAYDVESMRFVLPFVDQPGFAQLACESIVELAHHREVRDPNKAEFDKALDKVIQVSKDAVVVERANRYKRGETWERPKK